MLGPPDSRIKGAKVAPHEAGVPSDGVSWLSRLKVRCWMGMLYVATTLYASASFLKTASVVVVNDLFWSKFDPLTGGAFVANAFNSVLPRTRNATTMQLTDAVFAQRLTGSLKKRSTITASSLYARQVQYDRLTTIEDAIIGLRHLPAISAPTVFTQYCWLDFDRRWSLAHTAQRAERCWHDHASSAAVYLESVLRNIRWAEFEIAWGHEFESAIAGPVRELEGGATFLDNVKKNGSVAFVDEVRYWQQYGMTYHKLQYHNLWQVGVDEKIVNAFGVRYPFTIKSIDFAAVDGNTRMSGMSLIRNSTNFFENHNVTMEQILVEDGDIPAQFTPAQANFRAAVGPYGSIDMIWTMFPPELSALMHQAQTVIMEAALTTSKRRAAFASIGANIQLGLSPKAWTDGGWTFVNGNPLCSSTFSSNYVLQQFAFEDGCQPIAALACSLSLELMIAALVSNVFDGNNTHSVCRTGALNVDACRRAFDTMLLFIRDFISPKQQQLIRESAITTHAVVTALNVSIIQFVRRDNDSNSNKTEHALLVEPVLSPDFDSEWNAFGWMLLYEWVVGIREVVSFQGDHGKLTILFSMTAPIAIAPNTAEITATTAFYLLMSMQYVTVVLVFVAVIVLIYAITDRFAVDGSNLFKFNRVTGIVWVGRPMLFLRGIVATCILSTAQPEMVVDSQLVWMKDFSTSWINSLLTAGEATWLLYIALDLVLECFGGYFYYVAQSSNALTFLAVAILRLISPTDHKMVIDPHCHHVDLENQVACTSGAIYVGNSLRFVTILAMTALVSLSCFILVRWICPKTAKRTDCMALPGVAQEMFARSDWIYNKNWFIDRASAAMAGLPSFHLGAKIRVFNINTWCALDDNRASASSENVRIQRAICLGGLKSRGED